MIQRGQGKVSFLPLRMFENYLLDPDAIAAVAKGIDGFGEITPILVRAWLETHQWDIQLFTPGPSPSDRSPSTWIEHVSGAKVLERVFADLSEARVSYDKVRHGQALTDWLLRNKPTALQPLADFIADRIPAA
jgi:hypothetical protein